jgi:hypothetical protein
VHFDPLFCYNFFKNHLGVPADHPLQHELITKLYSKMSKNSKNNAERVGLSFFAQELGLDLNPLGYIKKIFLHFFFTFFYLFLEKKHMAQHWCYPYMYACNQISISINYGESVHYYMKNV